MPFSAVIKQAVRAALWPSFLTFPLLVIKINPYERTVAWRWQNLLYVALATFSGSLLAQTAAALKARKKLRAAAPAKDRPQLFDKTAVRLPALSVLLLLAAAFPWLVSSYQVSIMITALLYVMLGLGLNIVVGMAGLLDLGYVAFYAVGAYSYALLNLHFGIGFWTALPIGGFLAAIFGIFLGFPVLRLRGDYLAIVTLGFGEIIRLVLENWTEFSQGPSGISGIPRPGFFGMELSLQQSVIYLYYLMLGMVVFTILATNRLQHSRIGRAWAALREDEIACRAMGIDKTKIKLAAFAFGAFWAGMAGVLFAAKTTFVNPASFTFMESAIILCIVVLGGMGSIPGVIIAALTLILLPEYLRTLADYRMLAFGAALVLMMRFRPGGLFPAARMRRQK
ncbi:ABC transporter permease subunit [Candidatus Electronema sp. TJ]|uniref:ABC transporter permease subunit n=1 Tax=Candidatus Electronema sp. TJ TaxID=3401573 RepID=UPI003AA8C536